MNPEFLRITKTVDVWYQPATDGCISLTPSNMFQHRFPGVVCLFCYDYTTVLPQPNSLLNT